MLSWPKKRCSTNSWTTTRSSTCAGPLTTRIRWPRKPRLARMRTPCSQPSKLPGIRPNPPHLRSLRTTRHRRLLRARPAQLRTVQPATLLTPTLMRSSRWPRQNRLELVPTDPRSRRRSGRSATAQPLPLRKVASLRLVGSNSAGVRHLCDNGSCRRRLSQKSSLEESTFTGMQTRMRWSLLESFYDSLLRSKTNRCRVA
mmetsp:Transcript_13123/g.33509  ORF Transcript_13123/g.33509 Transcript_13123/m.33509 type:complete len:200 (+) Transcript_13123:183-782(+)